MLKEPPDIGIVAFMGAMASYIFGPEVAVFVGPYVVILLASTIGASFALARREVATRGNAVWFFVRTNGLAVLLTVGIASLVSGHHPDLTEKALIAPIAFVVGLIGDDWPNLARWAGSKVNSLVDVLIKLRGGGNG